MTLAMFLLGMLTVASAGVVVAARKPLNSALALVVTLFLVAGHFALMEAHFIALIQILVYAGAIMVLVVFVIMLLGVEGEVEGFPMRSMGHKLIGVVMAGFIGLLVISIERGLFRGSVESADTSGLSNVEGIADLLFTKYVFPFEITAVLLLAAVIGAVVLAFEPSRSLPEGRGLQAMRKPQDKN